ncbi:MAG TPA: type II secretion system protein [Chthoniobacterales bacterium]|nr:type II secretion system protein [Chthoniobacterales bacterium]
MKRQPPTAFTLIELLVVITIIAILASFALPAYTAVQERAQQTKDLSNAKQIALALKQFAADNNGSFPAKAPGADYAAAADLTSANKSNDAFWWLFPNYLQSEDIFVVSGSKWTPANPDNKIDAAGSAARTESLKSGEDNYAYVTGLTDTSNPAFPLITDGFSSTIPKYDTSKSNKGGLWAAKKAIVAFCDASGQIMKVDDVTNLTVKRPGHGYSIFDNGSSTSSDPWLTASNLVLNPE